MTAARIREAAKVLRDAAEGATPGPWIQNGGNGIHTRVGSCIATSAKHYDERRKADATYIALMQPPVALALADWLDDIANRDRPEEAFWPHLNDLRAAKRLAETILGGKS